MYSIQNDMTKLRAGIDKRIDGVNAEMGQLWGAVEKWSADMQQDVRPDFFFASPLALTLALCIGKPTVC
jgi:hypothetical protein